MFMTILDGDHFYDQPVEMKNDVIYDVISAGDSSAEFLWIFLGIAME